MGTRILGLTGRVKEGEDRTLEASDGATGYTDMYCVLHVNIVPESKYAMQQFH